MTLVEFLLARIAQDEEHARSFYTVRVGVGDIIIDGTAPNPRPGGTVKLAEFGEVPFEDVFTPSEPDPRQLAEIAAKRQAVATALEYAAAIDAEFGCCHRHEAFTAELEPPDFEGDVAGRIPDSCSGMPLLREALAPLAGVYADHPDYDAAWADSGVPAARPS